MDVARILEVDGLIVDFFSQGRRVRAVNGVSFHIGAGETLALVGESGSGKSVTALTLTRLSEYDQAKIAGGRISLRRKDDTVVDVLSLPGAALRGLRGRDVAYIFQEPMTSLNPVYTVGRQIAEAIELHQRISASETGDRVLKALDQVRIPDPQAQVDRFPHQLSGGMRQRVMIAMALCSRPRLLVADEPTTALDVTVQAQILDLIRLLQSETGMSVLFITHDMGVVAEVADRVAVMRDGAVIECADARSLFAQPSHAYTRSLLDAIPRLGSMKGRDGPERFEAAESL